MMRYHFHWDRFIRYMILVAAFGLMGSSAARGQSFTLEDVLSAPFPTHLVAARRAERIAWVFNERGVRNIWTAAAPDFAPVRLTDYREDDGQELSDLQLTPDGSILVYVRGGNPNRAGEIPNPTSDPRGAEQAIWAIRTSGGSPWKLAEGHHPVIAPSGDRLVFIRRGQIYQLPLVPPGANAEGKLEPLFRARGRNGSPRWSPDGRRVAFVSDRGDHSFIGVYDLREQRIRWMEPSVDRDMLPAWSPDGRRLAFIRMPGRRKHERRNLVTGYPFAIWVVDVETGRGREIWHSPGRDGGFAQYYPGEPLRWASDDRLLFYSEHEGWLHIYAISASGGSPIDLTPGESIAEQSSLSVDGTVLYYSSNRGDIDRRHIWKVPTGGGSPVRLTAGTGIETYPVVLADGEHVAFLGATATRPPAVSLIATAGGRPRLIAPQRLPEAFPERQLVAPQPVTFRAADGWEIHGQLFLPRGAKPGDRRPAVIFMHGGPIRQMLLGWHYMGYYANAYAMNQYLVSKGMIVLSVNYRSGIGYGRAFRQAPHQGPRGASEYQDIVAAGLYLRHRPEVDPDRIGLWGGSYGGYLTALGLARDSDLFAAGVDLHGVHDWAFRATDFSPGGGWGLEKRDLDLAYQSSPVADLASWSSPVLLIHGDDDRNVLFGQTVDLVQRLRERNVHVEVLVFPDEVHGFLRYESWLRAYRRAAEFFERFLGARRE